MKRCLPCLLAVALLSLVGAGAAGAALRLAAARPLPIRQPLGDRDTWRDLSLPAVRLGGRLGLYSLVLQAPSKSVSSPSVAIYRLSAGRRTLLRRTALDLYAPVRNLRATRLRRTHTVLLTADEMTRFGTRVVWRVDPRSYRARFLLRASGGSMAHLAHGVVEEHTMAKYAYGFPLPSGLQPGDACARTWRYDARHCRFRHGPWRVVERLCRRTGAERRREHPTAGVSRR